MKEYELLEAQARMMRMAEKYGLDEWRKLISSRLSNGAWCNNVANPFDSYWDDRRFALGVVEGNPVFDGDTLWHCNRKFTADGHLPDYIADMKNPSELSWNPPKPKTVMVELLVEDAQTLKDWILSQPVNQNVAEACRKALEAQSA